MNFVKWDFYFIFSRQEWKPTWFPIWQLVQIEEDLDSEAEEMKFLSASDQWSFGVHDQGDNANNL